MFFKVMACHWLRTASTWAGSGSSATATAKVAPPASQPSMFKVVGSGPKGTCFCALSGLQGSNKLTPASKRTARQLRVGLHAVDNKPASATNRLGANARERTKIVMN